MRDVFEHSFGLCDNPFNPLEFQGVEPGLLDDLSTRALRIDEAPGLLPLFVPEAGPFAGALRMFEDLLRLSGYQTDPQPKLGPKSFFFRVIGPQGSGKSTMTNVMIEWLKRCHPERNLLVVKGSLRRPGDASDQAAAARRRIVEVGAKSCCLAFDDVSSTEEPELHDLYRDLQDTSNAVVVLFAIMHQAEDLRRPRLSAPVPVHEFRTSGLTAEHARVFVERRVDVFRTDSARQVFYEELSLFPFDESDLADAIGPQHANNGAGPITLRALNQILHRGLERAALSGPAPFADRARHELRSLTVKLLEMFREEMRAAA